ncbi:MAG TPA: hypothetical protein VIO11_00130 [Candidatus Methanoperedens sp.]
MKRYTGDTKKSAILIFTLLFSIFIMTGLASANVSNNTNDTIKFSIKSKFLGVDNNFNTEIMHFNITISKPGNLTYIENYYLEGSESLKFQSSTRYFDANLTDKNISFNISRPKPGSIYNRRYVFIESIILLDGEMIFNKTVNLSNRYKLDYTNIPAVKLNAKAKSPINTTGIKNITNIKNNTNLNSNIKNDLNINKTTVAEKIKGFETIAVGFEIIAAVAIFIIFIRLKRN